MGLARQLATHIVLPIARRAGLVRELARFIDGNVGPNGYGTLRDQFIRNGRSSRWDEAVRRDLVQRFERIHEHVPIHSSPSDWLFVAEAALSSTASGEIVECGCFAGGSTAHLSILAKLIGKKLYVFDSFEGLPPINPTDGLDYHARYTNSFNWHAGINTSPIEQTRANVERYGEPSVCTFIKGWFSDTLTRQHLPNQLSLAYTDVVIASSARECR